MKNLSILLLLLLCQGSFARDNFTISFIKSYIVNEMKPTVLIIPCLCWKKHVKLNLVNELSKEGIRSSSSMKMKSTFQDQDLLYLIDLDCPDTAAVIAKASANNLLKGPFRWLALLNSTDLGFKTLALLWESPVLVDGDVVLAERKDDRFNLVELFKTSAKGTMQTTARGFYNGVLTDTRPHRELFNRRKNLLKHKLTMSNVIHDSNATQYHLPKEDRLEPQHDSITKTCWMNAHLVFQMLNATPGYIFSHKFGSKRNGSWQGMVGHLDSDQAVIGTNCLLIVDRMETITYMDVAVPFRSRFIFRQPPLAYESNIFSLPFSNNVWLAVAMCAAVSTVTLYFASKWEASLGRSPSQLDGSIGDALLLTMSAVGQQGCVMEPSKISGRIMLWVVFTALMALYAAYSANIVVLLQAPSNSINNLGQLARSKITLGAYDVDYNYFVFSQNLHHDPTEISICKRVKPDQGNKNYYNLHEGVEKIRKGLFAFHSMIDPIYRRIEETFLETEKCDLMEVDFLNGFDPFLPAKKDSPYLELLEVGFKRVREAGFHSANIKRLLTPKPRCSNQVAAFSSVGIQDLMPVIVLMLYGIAASVCIAVVEIIVSKICKNRKYNVLKRRMNIEEEIPK